MSINSKNPLHENGSSRHRCLSFRIVSPSSCL